MKTFEDWVKEAEELGHPTEGEWAMRLWQLCSSHRGLPVTDGKMLYMECGYIPFQGYPLVRIPS